MYVVAAFLTGLFAVVFTVCLFYLGVCWLLRAGPGISKLTTLKSGWALAVERTKEKNATKPDLP